MVNEEITKRLWETIYSTKNKTFEQVKFVGSNAATLLAQRRIPFEKSDLSQTVLAGADLKGCDLSEANLEGCDLDRVSLCGCRFSEEVLKLAKFNKIEVTLVLVIASSGNTFDRIIKGIPELTGTKINITKAQMIYDLSYKSPIFVLTADLMPGFDWALFKSKAFSFDEFTHIGLFKNEMEDISKDLNNNIYNLLLRKVR